MSRTSGSRRVVGPANKGHIGRAPVCGIGASHKLKKAAVKGLLGTSKWAKAAESIKNLRKRGGPKQQTPTAIANRLLDICESAGIRLETLERIDVINKLYIDNTTDNPETRASVLGEIERLIAERKAKKDRRVNAKKLAGALG